MSSTDKSSELLELLGGDVSEDEEENSSDVARDVDKASSSSKIHEDAQIPQKETADINEIFGGLDDEEDEEDEENENVKLKASNKRAAKSTRFEDEEDDDLHEIMGERLTKIKSKHKDVDADEENLKDENGSSDEDDIEDDEAEAEADGEEGKRAEVLDKILGGKGHFKPKEKTVSHLTLEQAAYKIPTSSDCMPLFMRLPKFIKIQMEGYEKDDNGGREKFEREAFENATAVIRWASSEQSDAPCRSNTRLVKWNDGSYQLVVGDAIFNAKLASADNW